MKNNQIVIQKARAKLYTNSKRTAYNLKDHISEFLTNVLFKIIEDYLAKYESENHLSGKITVLDHLNLKVAIDERNYKSQFSRLLLEDDIKKQLDVLFNSSLNGEEMNADAAQTVHSPENPAIKTKKVIFSETDILQNSFLYFLKHGAIPWYCSKEIQQQLFALESMEQLFIENKNDFIKKFLKVCSEANVRQRFASQLDEELAITILYFLFSHDKTQAGPDSGLLSVKDTYFYHLSRTEKRIILTNLFELWYRPDSDKNIRAILHCFKIPESVSDNRKEAAQQLFSILKSDNFYEELLKPDWSAIIREADLTFSPQEEKQGKEAGFIPKKDEKNAGLPTPGQEKEDMSSPKEEVRQAKETSFTEKDGSNPDLPTSEQGKEEIINSQKDEKNADLLTLEQENGLTVPNAGLVIIHPFLKTFFSRLDLLTADSILKDPELCVHLLHYLATGVEQDFEYRLAFEKMLCGVPSGQPIERFVYLSEEMKKEANELLQVVLDNWPIIRNSGTELLQNEFLRREGAIRIDEQNIHISFERKAQDILIDKLEWTLSFIKLPWLRKIIRVNW